MLFKKIVDVRIVRVVQVYDVRLFLEYKRFEGKQILFDVLA